VAEDEEKEQVRRYENGGMGGWKKRQKDVRREPKGDRIREGNKQGMEMK
jgi:hypothetical protein